MVRRPSPKLSLRLRREATLRSVEFSLERLGIDRIDILFAHNLDVFNHGSQTVIEDEKLAKLMDGYYNALLRLREDGTVAAFGAF